MFRVGRGLVGGIAGCLFWAAGAFAAEGPSSQPGPAWLGDYALAVKTAQQEGKMLLIHFHTPGSEACRRLESEALADPAVVEKLKRFALLKLPTDAEVQTTEAGDNVVLLRHDAFAEMLGCPGLAIIDYAHRASAHYGHVVSVFPMTDNAAYSAEQVGVMLDLPPGTLTQRTMVYAVRTHPERPASTHGHFDPTLASEAECHSEYQARIGSQGHHFWDVRFQRIIAGLPNGGGAREVCAESWPGQRLLESAIECVRCWRHSSGHWSAVSAYCPYYAYDIKRGANGVWYATGIVAGN